MLDEVYVDVAAVSHYLHLDYAGPFIGRFCEAS